MDAKGRVALPVRVRESLTKGFSGQLTLTRDVRDNCLLLYPAEVFDELRKKIDVLPNFHDYNRALQRRFVGHATELTIDASGRILIPPELRRVAQLNRDLVLMGQARKYEIWSEEVREAEDRREQAVLAANVDAPGLAGISI